MKKKCVERIAASAAAVCLSAAVLISAVSCANGGKGDVTAAGSITTSEPTSDIGKASAFTVIYPSFGAATATKAANKIASALGIEAKSEKDVESSDGCEILVGATERDLSSEAKTALEAADTGRAYSYLICRVGNKIAIVGSSSDAVAEAADVFIDEYVTESSDGYAVGLADGQTVIDGYDFEIQKLSNGTKLKTEVISQIYKPDQPSSNSQYPTIIELQHNGDSNGILLASFESFDGAFKIRRSTDGGETWKIYSFAAETLDTTLVNQWEPHLYELPCQVGDMPEGTLLLAGTSIDGGLSRKSHVAIWRSNDCGKHWKEYTVVDSAGGLKEGLWEPYLMYDNGWLYCFYSDDSDPEHDQKLVYMRSKDGVNWVDKTDVCAADEFKWRPGMISVTKMGNGKYFAVYEVCNYDDNSWGGPLYYKIVDSLDGDWDVSSLGNKFSDIVGDYGEYIGNAPWCGWTSAGGENGILFVVPCNGSQKRIFYSLDYGESFKSVSNPLPHEDEGYSPSVFFSTDGKTLFYGNTVDFGSETGKVMFARIKIE